MVVSAAMHVNNYLAELPSGMVRGVKGGKRPQRGGRVFDWVGDIFDRAAISRTNPDIVHETYYARKVIVPASIPTVLTVFDMIQERFACRFPGQFPPRDDIVNRKAAAISRASHVICISENTRRDLLELYKLDSKKVSVVHLGYDLLNGGRDSDRLTFNDTLPYLLYVGERAGYKNFKALLRAYAGSTWLRNNFRIVCFGGGAFRADEMELAKELAIKPYQLEQVGGGDDVLVSYYQRAAAFIYPSLYEGFGIPPLEAMALGCPVICSNTSSIPEVVGDAGEYFDPERIDSICASVEVVLQSAEKRADLIQKGFRKCNGYSWDRCAAKTLEIYRGLVK